MMTINSHELCEKFDIECGEKSAVDNREAKSFVKNIDCVTNAVTVTEDEAVAMMSEDGAKLLTKAVESAVGEMTEQAMNAAARIDVGIVETFDERNKMEMVKASSRKKKEKPVTGISDKSKPLKNKIVVSVDKTDKAVEESLTCKDAAYRKSKDATPRKGK